MCYKGELTRVAGYKYISGKVNHENYHWVVENVIVPYTK